MRTQLMQRGGRLFVLGMVLTVALFIPAIGAGKESPIVTAIGYSDVVRFQAQGKEVAALQVKVFDLGGQRLYDSGPTMGKALDWAMTTEAGERAAHGVYLYVITAWDSGGELLKSRVGKLALVPGGVGLGQAPALIALCATLTAGMVN